MLSKPTFTSEELSDRVDQRVFFHGVSWEQYEQLLALRGESSRPRIAYLEGELEIMTPSYDHEAIKTTFARLVEAWADEHELDLVGVGSWTLKKEEQQRGVEPDECYYLLKHPGHRPEVPDMAIEVVWTPGGLEKLEIYRGLGVREVWIWRAGKIEVHSLRKAGYARIRRSRVLPDVDLGLIARYCDHPNQPAAVRAFRAAIRKN